MSIDPSGTLSVTGPTELTATVANMPADVTWTLSGPGALSATAGLQVIYTPPAGTAMATVTASAGTLTADVTLMTSPAALTSATIPGLTGTVTVLYDAEDIPHIQCATTLDCVAVQGYLQARDRLFPMDFLRHVARSTLSEMIGPAGVSQDVQIRTIMITRSGQRLEDALVAALDAPSRALITAYAGGVNAYLAQLKATNGKLPGEYDQLPFPLTPADIADWTPQDTLALARLQQFQLSETLEQESAFGQFAAAYASGPLADAGKMNAWIRAAAPPTEQAHTLSPTPSAFARPLAPSTRPAVDMSGWSTQLAAVAKSSAALRAFLRPATEVGSNNWVIAGAKSATGHAMVANDPHLSLQYPPLFHLAVMTSSTASDNLDLAGGSFPGIPGALVGRGAHVGWGVTVVGYDVTDLYLEQFLPQGSCPSAAPCVLFKGAPTSTIPVPQTYRVRVGPGNAFVPASSLPNPPPPVVLVVPHHGPIVQAPDAAGKAVSVRWTGQEGNTADLRAFFGLNTATDVDAGIEALKSYATGAQNFVLADDQGHIAYDPHALVPVRKFADIRVVGAGAMPPWFPLPGDGSAEWGDGTSNCAAATATPVPASCWISDAELPHGKDPAKGYFFTANADPTSPSVSDDNSPLAHPPYLSFDWDDSTGFRATRIEKMIEAALAAHGTVSLEDMQAIQSDHVSRLGKVFTDIIATIPTDANSPAELVTAKMVLAQWATNGWDCPSGLTSTDPNGAADSTTAVQQNSAGCFLFHAFLRQLLTRVFTDDLAVIGQGVDQLQTVKAMIFMLGLPPNDAGAKFCNDVSSKGQTVATHSCIAQVATALVASVKQLEGLVDADPKNWVWGRVHTITPVSLLQLVTRDYSPGPYARPGGAFTVDVGSPRLSGAGLDFQYFAGGNVRHISLMDPAKPTVKMQLPGPERDAPATFVGPDLLGQWVKNTYFDFAFGDQINAAAVSTQTFKAQ